MLLHRIMGQSSIMVDLTSSPIDFVPSLGSSIHVVVSIRTYIMLFLQMNSTVESVSFVLIAKADGRYKCDAMHRKMQSWKISFLPPSFQTSQI